MSSVGIFLSLMCLLCLFVSGKSVSGQLSESRPCTGPHCPHSSRLSRPAWQYYPITPSRSAGLPNPPNTQHGIYATPDVVDSHTHTLSHARESTRTHLTVEASGPACAGTDCITTKRPQAINDTRECRGLECRLPLRIRTKHRLKPCLSEDCGGEEGPVHVSDRAAQFLGEFPDIGYPASDLGGAPLGVQLTCDIKPGKL